MIELEISKSGHPVLKKNGRLLASKVQPQQEAVAWAEKIGAAVVKGDSIAVLGIGCGYHVAALKKLKPENPILVIENDQELAHKAIALHDESPDVIQPNEVVVESNWIKLVDDMRVRDLLGGTFRIALHGPSVQMEPEYFTAVDRLFRGRDKLSFLILLKTRPELLPLLNAEAVKSIGDEAISIKTIQRLFSEQSITSRERRIWKILEELVV